MKVKEILAEYDPHFMPMGLDEAYLNVTEHLEERLHWPEDKRRYFLNTENTTEKSKQSTLFFCLYRILQKSSSHGKYTYLSASFVILYAIYL